MKRLKVLISAYACSPRLGSEPGMGWGWVNALAQHHDLWVITEKNEFEADILQALGTQSELTDRIRFFFVPIGRRVLSGYSGTAFFYWFYKNWQKKAYRLARSLHEKVGFDLVHQLNMIGYREPGYLWRLDAPFVWGPVGGTANVPIRFARILGPSQSLYHLARNIVNTCQLRHHRRVDAALARANGLIAATETDRRALLSATGKDSVVISSTAVEIDPQSAGPRLRYSFLEQPLRLVWAGLHVSRKALPILLQALALVPPKYIWHLDILGAGPMTHSWQNLAGQLGLAESCTWHGWLPEHHQALGVLATADALVFTSLLEGTPTVVLEAMARGLAVVCFDCCGMADVVTEDCGIKIPVTTWRRAVKDFTGAIKRLAENPLQLKRLSEGARRRAIQYSWQSRAQQMLQVYQQAIENWQQKHSLTQSPAVPESSPAK